MYLQEDMKLLLVSVNSRLMFEIEIVHDLLCQPIFTFHIRHSQAKCIMVMPVCVFVPCRIPTLLLRLGSSFEEW